MGESCCSTSDTGEQCATHAADSKAPRCPDCGGDGQRVDGVTVAALTRGHVAPPQAFRLCRSAACRTVYYGALGARFSIDDMHVVPGFKISGPEGLVCYCFMHSRGDIEQELLARGETSIPQRITAEIKTGNCACEVRNPAGRCCLGEVNQAVATLRERRAEVVK